MSNIQHQHVSVIKEIPAGAGAGTDTSITRFIIPRPDSPTKSWLTPAELMQRPFQNHWPYFRNVILDAYFIEQLEGPESGSEVFYYRVIKR